MSNTLTLLVILASKLAVGIPAESITSKQSNPTAPRGGVLMVQLLCKVQGDQWPATLEVTFENGQIETGILGWIEHNTNDNSWTNNPSWIRPILPTDNTLLIQPTDAVTGPVLLVQLPNDGDGLIRFGEDAIDPNWIDLPASFPNTNISPVDDTKTLSPSNALDRPEWSSLEYWRWVIVASRLGVLPPEPPNDTTVALMSAKHIEQMWRIGFDRLARSSRSVAATCRDFLTNTVQDGDQSFACWVVQQESLDHLLSILLDTTISSRQLSSRALRWAQVQQPYLQWLDQVFGAHVTLAIANPTLVHEVVEMKWETLNNIPIAVQVPAGETVHYELERTTPIDLSIFGPEPSFQLQQLLVTVGNKQFSFPIVPQSAVATPPSVQLSTLYPLWDLQSIRRGTPNQISPSQSTSVQVRKLLGVWELFITCKGKSIGKLLPLELDDLTQLRGTETITILHQKTNAMICIPLVGESYRENIPSDLHVFTATVESGWNVRVELPSDWVRDGQLSFSIVRSHGDSMQIETGPLPCVPWNISPAPIVIDLHEWDSVVNFPTLLPIH